MSGQLSATEEQLAYYRAVADEYEDHALDAPGQDELLSAINSYQPTGDVLELACGSGVWTERLQRSAASVTAVDAAPEMLALARTRLGPGKSVRFVEADLFSWHPARRYDTVFFGFWISHVPEDRFDSFWDLVDEALEPDGRVFFFDDNHRSDIEMAEGVHSPIVRRELNDGTQFRVIKIPYEPAQLERRLRELGWDIKVTRTAGPFYWGTGGR
jgi:demethylmenaquinone methyltransferase/2-methoxy-6-polyprenyl-1,4-benzoquinol methylase